MSELRLYCLPYAGGDVAIYREWPARLPAWVRLKSMHLPGRGRLLNTPPLHDWNTLVQKLLDDIDPDDPRPLALFGHSMGALLAFELAFALRQQRGVQPVWLGVSACSAPSMREQGTPWLERSDQEVIAEMRRLNGTPEALLSQPDWLDLVLPTLRADFHLCGTYRYQQRLPLDSAISVFVGRDDELTRPAASRDAWRVETRGGFTAMEFAGDHFFIHSHGGQVIAAVGKQLTDVMADTSLHSTRSA